MRPNLNQSMDATAICDALSTDDPLLFKDRFKCVLPDLLRKLEEFPSLLQLLRSKLSLIFICFPPTTGVPMILAKELGNIFHRYYGSNFIENGNKNTLAIVIDCFKCFATNKSPKLAEETSEILQYIVQHHQHSPGIEHFLFVLTENHSRLFISNFKVRMNTSNIFTEVNLMIRE